jgi:hypothetical protein
MRLQLFSKSAKKAKVKITIPHRICRIRVFLGLPDPRPDPLVKSTDPARDPSLSCRC